MIRFAHIRRELSETGSKEGRKASKAASKAISFMSLAKRGQMNLPDLLLPTHESDNLLNEEVQTTFQL